MNTEHTLEEQNTEIIQPFHPKNLFNLFFKPKTFFSQSNHYHHKSIMLMAYLIGVVAVMDRIDQKLLSSELGQSSSFTDSLTETWFAYWLWVLGMGILSAALAWVIQGWWYKTRLQFSGVRDADSQLARHVFVLQALVYVLPIIVVTLIQTFLYKNYVDAYNNSTFLAVITIPFLLLSCWVSYRAATQVFNTNAWAKFWFLGMPVVFYITIGGLFAALVN